LRDTTVYGISAVANMSTLQKQSCGCSQAVVIYYGIIAECNSARLWMRSQFMYVRPHVR